jgi:sporulation protein YlmC with PRC-barrel domain
MTAESEYRMGARVFASDGGHVGSLIGLVVDREALEPHALVVKESRWFTGHILSPGAALLVDEVAVPLEGVARVAPDRIDLALTADQVRRLPPYLTYRYTSLGPAHMGVEAIELVGGPGVPPLVETAGKRGDEIEISSGEPVLTADGDRLGTVKEVLVQGEELVGVVLHPRGLFGDEVIMPRRFLRRGDDLALRADLSRDDIGRLRPFRPHDRGS